MGRAPGVSTDGRSILSFPNLVLGVIALFLYVGVEVMAGDTIGIYGSSLGMPLSATNTFYESHIDRHGGGLHRGHRFHTEVHFTEQSVGRFSRVGRCAHGCRHAAFGYSSVMRIALLGFWRTRSLALARHLAVSDQWFGPTY